MAFFKKAITILLCLSTSVLAELTKTNDDVVATVEVDEAANMVLLQTSSQKSMLARFNSSDGASLKQNRLDINQKAYFNGTEIVGPAEGSRMLDQCIEFIPATIPNPEQPVVNFTVKVCGTRIKMTLYSNDYCNGYTYRGSQPKVIGKCDTGLPPQTCETFSPDEDYEDYEESSGQMARAYKVEECSPYR